MRHNIRPNRIIGAKSAIWYNNELCGNCCCAHQIHLSYFPSPSLFTALICSLSPIFSPHSRGLLEQFKSNIFIWSLKIWICSHIVQWKRFHPPTFPFVAAIDFFPTTTRCFYHCYSPLPSAYKSSRNKLQW